MQKRNLMTSHFSTLCNWGSLHHQGNIVWADEGRVPCTCSDTYICRPLCLDINHVFISPSSPGYLLQKIQYSCFETWKGKNELSTKNSPFYNKYLPNVQRNKGQGCSLSSFLLLFHCHHVVTLYHWKFLKNQFWLLMFKIFWVQRNVIHDLYNMHTLTLDLILKLDFASSYSMWYLNLKGKMVWDWIRLNEICWISILTDSYKHVQIAANFKPIARTKF